MGSHNISFYEEISKIITELSSNIIKYAPYFFCWYSVLFPLSISLIRFYDVCLAQSIQTYVILYLHV